MKIKKVINCTPHSIVVYSLNEKYGEIMPYEIEASGIIPRVEESTEKVDLIESPVFWGWEIVRKKFSGVINLPEYEEGTALIVSSLVKSASSRTDLCTPHDFVRDVENKIIGCRGFAF